MSTCGSKVPAGRWSTGVTFAEMRMMNSSDHASQFADLREEAIDHPGGGYVAVDPSILQESAGPKVLIIGGCYMPVSFR
ncbi:hypothetical protein [Nocardia carnea]|uniref:hypothetical protein n=1 Tax=Nocardia carnea TaxID=37328 RepID=UPI002457BCE0|nr:hypothetical protein [Nocardia carnea]